MAAGPYKWCYVMARCVRGSSLGDCLNENFRCATSVARGGYHPIDLSTYFGGSLSVLVGSCRSWGEAWQESSLEEVAHEDGTGKDAVRRVV
jgi:hypothetical protein